jgi:sugar phosphate isomerase/epimerase
MGKKISIGSWAYVFNQKEEVSFHKILHGLQDLKLDGVELGSFGKHPTPKSHPTKADRLRLKKEVEDHGLGFSGIAPDLWSFKLVSVEDPAPYLAAFLGYCVFAQDLGIKLIRVDAVEVPSVFEKNNIDPKLGFDRAVKAWNIACKMAADHGLQVSWEFEPGFAFNKPSEIVAMIDAVRALGNNNFGAMYDTCHAHMCAAIGALQPGTKEILPGGGVELLHNLKGRVNHVHLIDSDGSLNEHATSTHNPFGTGHLNFDEYIPALLAAGIPSDWWCIDLCFWPDAWDVTADSMKYLGDIKKKYAAQGA